MSGVRQEAGTRSESIGQDGSPLDSSSQDGYPQDLSLQDGAPKGGPPQDTPLPEDRSPQDEPKHHFSTGHVVSITLETPHLGGCGVLSPRDFPRNNVLGSARAQFRGEVRTSETPLLGDANV